MAKFGDLDEYFDPGLVLTVRGKEYTLPLPSAELGLWCRRIAQTAGEVSDATTDQELQEAGERGHARAAALPPLPGDLTFEERMLGAAYTAMVTDAVPDPYIHFCAQTAYIWIIGGEDAAERYWTCGGRPERLARTNRADRRNAQKTNTAAAPAMTPPASTSGMSSRPRSRRRGGAARSRGSSS